MRTSAMILVLAFLAMRGQPAMAAEDCGGGRPTCCNRCGRQAVCAEKCCQVVCEMKKETKTCWQVECQEICPLMPGCRGCGECRDGQESCGSGECRDKCSPLPRCGHPKCVKKLVKKEYQVEKPVYKCVVRHLCADCCTEATPEPVTTSPSRPAGPPSPPMPPAPLIGKPAPQTK